MSDDQKVERYTVMYGMDPADRATILAGFRMCEGREPVDEPELRDYAAREARLRAEGHPPLTVFTGPNALHDLAQTIIRSARPKAPEAPRRPIEAAPAPAGEAQTPWLPTEFGRPGKGTGGLGIVGGVLSKPKAAP